MKEIYFTPESIRERTEQFRRDVGLIVGQSTWGKLKTPALLVLDMQRFFLDERSHAFIPSAPVIVSGLVSLVESFRERSLPVVFTRHVNTESNAGMMAKWWKDLIRDDDSLSELHDSIAVGGGVVIEKAQYDAFHKTGLEQLLREQGVEQVVITGVMTHLCCESTARSAFVRGFEVLFAVDGTATYTEAFHRATLLNLAHGFARLVTAQEVIDELELGRED